MDQDDSVKRKKLADVIASMPYLDSKIMGINSQVTLKCKHGEVPKFRKKTLEKYCKEFGIN